MRRTPFTFQPSPGRSRNSTRRAVWACGWIQLRIPATAFPPYYDSLVGKLIVHGKSRNECLMRLRRALDEIGHRRDRNHHPAVPRADQTADILDGDYNIHWLEHYLARRATGAL
jgi:acetyl-CoA carboxylase biotin carboxylase subunit